MIGLDANVLIRYFAEDDPVQLKTVTEILDSQLTPESPGFVSIVALVELIWVLRSRYRFKRLELARVVQTLLRSEKLVVQEQESVYVALDALRDNLGSFSDLLVRELGAKAGCEVTMTFDRKAARLDGFELIG